MIPFSLSTAQLLHRQRIAVRIKEHASRAFLDVRPDAVIAANPDKVVQALEKPALAGWFVGQVMKATGGKANPQAVSDLVKARLGLE